jgi:hypothetical protein
LAIPNRHTEATTSRPLLLHGIGRQTTHGNQTTLTITSNHAQAEPIRRTLEGVSRLLQRLVETAEQFTVNQRWGSGFCGSFFAIGSKRARQIRGFYR